MKMKIALDYYNTISQHPDFFRRFAQTLIDGGADVYIISAVGDKRLKETGGWDKYLAEIESFNIPCSGICIVHFMTEQEIPDLKYQLCKTQGIELLIDDRPETIEYFNSRKILALLMPKPKK